MDRITKSQRSQNMRAVKSKNTKIEIMVRKALWHKGVRYRINYKVCGCKPDIVITKHRIAIFCDGDFWHGRDGEQMPVNNAGFWKEKINRNKERDLENTIDLRDAGWKVLRFWESDIINNLNECINVIINCISRKTVQDEMFGTARDAYTEISIATSDIGMVFRKIL